MVDVNTYSFLWEKGGSQFCLLECTNSQGTRYYQIYNPEDPADIVIFKPEHRHMRQVVIEKMLASNVKIISLDDKLDDPMRDFIRRQGWAPHILRNGLDYLILRWGKIVSNVVDGKPQYYYDYLNDMDTRRILGEILDRFPNEIKSEDVQRVQDLDANIRKVLVPTKSCIWGENTAQKRNYTADIHWYYYHYPPVIDNSWDGELVGNEGY